MDLILILLAIGIFAGALYLCLEVVPFFAEESRRRTELKHRHRPKPPPQPPRCWRCEYNLTGNESGVCPECGAEFVKAKPA